MTRKRVVWKNDELRWKNIESTRDVMEWLRVDVCRNCIELFRKGKDMKCYAAEPD